MAILSGKVDQSLRYRWGIVGILLAAVLSFFYFKDKVGLTSANEQITAEWNAKFAKIICPRCNNDPEKVKSCSLCNGLGYIWLDKTRGDIPEEIIVP